MNTKAFYTTLGILVAILGWFGSVQYYKLNEISKDLISLKLEIVRMQASIMDKEAVLEIVQTELLKHGIK